MSEEYFCLVGRVPKVLSYVMDNKYVHAVCKLKDNVDCFKLNEFFNRIYSLKLDIWDSQCGNDGHITVDLIKCFRLILKETSLINMKELCFLIRSFDNKFSYSILEIIREFLDMFEVTYERVVSLDDYKDIKVIIENSGGMFYKEVESIFYNSNVIDFVYREKSVKLKKQSVL